MLSLIAKYIVKPFKNFPFFGRLRFWLLYWAYRLTGWHIRHKEWDFVLEYLPPLMKGQRVTVFDVGCARNLFPFEVAARGYVVYGADLEKPVNGFPGRFITRDITKGEVGHDIDFVTCISVLEHIGNDGKGDLTAQVAAIQNMVNTLKIGGRLLLTCPTKEFAIGHEWHGFNIMLLRAMVPQNAQIIENTERAGQLCLVIERVV